jgi:hypothetical protein
MEIINRTANGTVFRCDKCKKIHIEFNNLNFNFAPPEYEFFVDFFRRLNEDFWESVNARSVYKRKIIVPIQHRNFMILMNSREVKEMKVLLGIEKPHLKKCTHALTSEIGIN